MWMDNFVKWIGGGVGWAFGGPVGGVLGFIGGSIFDSLEVNWFRKSDTLVFIGDFSENVLILIAAVLKAENKRTKAEWDYVKHFLKQNYGEKESSKALSLLLDLLKQNPPLEKVCGHIRMNLDYSSRLQLSHYLYNLANADGHATEIEQNILNFINRALGLSISDKRSVGSVLSQEDSIRTAYETLGVHRTTSIIDIKKAYRNLAIQCHPDKVAYLGEQLRKEANERFQQLTRSYEIIKKDRRFS